ncbi:MAG: hypothetical protein WBN27_06185, partial [Eudoraea sp.]
VGINGMTITYDENGDKLLFANDVRFEIKKSEDSIAHIRIRKDADGNSFATAKERANQIEYNYSVNNNTLSLDNFHTTDAKNKVRDQEVRITVFVPVKSVIRFDESAKRHIGRITRYDKDIYRNDIIDYQWLMQENGVLQCLDCPEELEEEDDEDEDGRIIINGDGVDIDIKDNGDSFKMKIDEDGVKIKTDDNN